MKKIIIMILGFAFISLACLSTSTTAEMIPEGPIETLTILTNATARFSETYIIDDVSPTAQLICAVVIADEALHVRELANVDAIILTWLHNGDVVEVLDQGINDWWEVRFNDHVGFAHSSYLIESRCEVHDE